MQLPGVNKRKLATYLAATTSLFLAACGGGEEKTTITDLSQLYEAPAVTTSIETVPGYERISFQDAQKNISLRQNYIDQLVEEKGLSESVDRIEYADTEEEQNLIRWDPESNVFGTTKSIVTNPLDVGKK